MTGKRPENMAASVKQRLLNLARQTGRPYSELSRHFSMERYLLVRYGLQGFQDARLLLRRDPALRLNREFVEERFGMFRKAG